MAIQSFRDRATEEFFITGRLAPKEKWGSVAKIVKRKLDMLHYAARLTDLKVPPANHLETLKKDLLGFCSIRVNDQWRVIFRWTENGPTGVYVNDYH